MHKGHGPIPLGTLVLGALTLALVAAACGGGKPAATGQRAAHAAGGGAAGRVKIVSPSENQLLSTNRVLVSLHTERSDPRLHVTTYGPGGHLLNISSRLHHVAPHVFDATLLVGRQLAYGRDSIYARDPAGGSRSLDEVDFLVAHAARGLVSVRRVEHGPYEVPPLNIRLASHGARLQVRLNGHDAGSSLEPLSAGRWSAALGPKDGLRYGANRLVVTASSSSGRYQRVSRDFRVRRSLPMADAGPNEIGSVGVPLRLNGSASQSSGGGPLQLRWQIVSRPPGTHPRLLDAESSHPRLETDVNGTYRLSLRATRPQSLTTSTGSRSTASASASGAQVTADDQQSTSEEQTTGGEGSTGPTGPTGEASSRAEHGATPAATTDEVVAEVAPDVPPTGMAVDTIASHEGHTGIELGEQFFPMQSGSAIQLLVISRTTLAVAMQQSFRAGEEGKVLEVVKGLEGEGANDLVILSGGDQGPYSASQPLLEAIDKIGGITSGSQMIGDIEELQHGNGGWSVIGIPKLPEGQAYQLIGLQQGEGATMGAIRGSFEKDSSGTHFAFNWPTEYNTFDTQSASTATENVMEVNGQRYPSWNLPFSGSSVDTGFQLLWFEADTLKLRLSQSFEMNLSTSESEQEKGLWPLRNDLRKMLAQNKPGILMLNTIGQVSTPVFPNRVGHHERDGNDLRGNVLARLASLLQEFGANPYVFDTLGASEYSEHKGSPGEEGTAGGYSLVGLTGIRKLKGPNAAAEASTRLVAGTTARLTGVLTRSRQGILEPGSTATPTSEASAGAAHPAVLKLLSEAGPGFTPWSQMTAEERAAQERIADHIEVPLDKRLDGIRADYWERPTIEWGPKAAELTSYCSNIEEETKGAHCTTAERALALQLAREFKQVGAVRKYFTRDETGTLADAFNNVFGESSDAMSAVSNEIRILFNPPPVETSGPDALGIFGGVLGIVGGVGEFVPVAGEEIGAAAEVTAGITEIVQSSASESDGESAFDPYGYHAKLSELSNELEESMVQALSGVAHVADLVVSDPGSLAQAAKLISYTEGPESWSMSTEQQDELESQLRQTLRQFMWLTMMQPVVATYECATEDIGHSQKSNPEAVMRTLVNYPEWRERESPRTFNLYPSFIALAERNHWGWPKLLSSEITKALFGAPDSGTSTVRDVGFLPDYLMAPALAVEGPENGHVDDRNTVPTSYGLLHKDIGTDQTEEHYHGLSERNTWSAYTPSCGWGQSSKWSNPEYASWAEP